MSREAARARRSEKGRRARDLGRRDEWLAAAWLMLGGWRVLGFRLKTPEGEIDLLVVRGRVLAAVEVKRRPTRVEAELAVSAEQAERLRRAVAAIAERRPGLAGRKVRVDLVALAPGRLPRHVPGALS
jgi:putative endonuclease